MYKRVFSQVGLLGSTEVLGRVFTFVFTAAVARTAGLETLGYLSLGAALIAFVTVASDGGLNQDATRRLLASETATSVIRGAVRVQFACAVVLFPIVLGITWMVYGEETLKYVAMFLPVPLLMSVSTPYLLDSRRRIRALAGCRLALTSTTAIAGLILLWIGASGPVLVLAYGCGYGLSAVLMLIVSQAPLAAIFSKAAPGEVRSRVKVVRRLGVASLLMHAFVSLPITVAGLAQTPGTLDLVGVITRVWFLVSAPAAMAGSVLIPVMSTAEGRNRISGLAWSAGALALGGAATLAAFARELLVLLYGVEAGAAAGAFSLFVLALPFTAVVAVFSSYLVARHQDLRLLAGYCLAVCIFILVTLTNWHEVGAARISFAWLISYMTLSAWLGFCVWQLRRAEPGRRFYTARKSRWRP